MFPVRLHTKLMADTSVDSFLESLGLEKYSTSFQVEEVDMDALMHMTDDDLKALLIPMDEEEHRVFRMRRNDKMSKVMERYTDARGAELGTYVFLSEGGSMINKDKTPDEMEIKDGDQIDAMLHQHGSFTSRQTVKNRLNGGSGDFSSHGRQLTTRKRGRQDGDKWEHDLFNDDKPRLSNRRVDPKDLRLKLQKKHHGLQTRLGGASLDLRQKLSGIKNPQPRSTSNLPNAIREATRPAVLNVSGETKAASNKATKKKPQQVNIIWML
ncbi:hypothetical protein F2Q70_00000292 [Brassica cretica]|uniref:SAM domain-containing protein n=1 Tax=Brassica cretica TaxID=69181 RepID=A0A8S9IYH5_BRACR|nr:hypothetical protein F2Q70_00000292 [Brassica cretica]